MVITIMWLVILLLIIKGKKSTITTITTTTTTTAPAPLEAMTGIDTADCTALIRLIS